MFHRALQLLSFALLSLSVNAATYPDFGTLQTTNSSGVMNVVINNTFSSTNLFDVHVMSDLANLIETLQANDTDIKVVVFSSANPEYFMPHVDLTYVLPGFVSPLPLLDPSNSNLTFLVGLIWNITQLPQATIAVIEGRARGIGNEFIMSCDMRFASSGPSVLFSQIETSFGVSPGAGGSMYLAHEIGRGRAFEYVFSSTNVDAQTAASIGWINRAFATSSELHGYVDALATRIALFPLQGIAASKKGINAASQPRLDVLIEYSQNSFAAVQATQVAQELEAKFLKATNNQSDGTVERNYGIGDDLAQFL